ncbi:hypothetical protein HPB52_007990 [Rhipicephalus sanguineus]|uniref:DUF5641 domain-containing protein n=1 Tax=Rhipicephalus sanguineus TaxID=34632 RepID=A0A9D4Q6A4_RHISA|nr:hypothetical protein HPB52_007990 [Rhipicephalus sanguineus]
MLDLQEKHVPSGVQTPRRAKSKPWFNDHTWKRWRKEYLLLLRSAHEAASKTPPRLQVGDVVLVHDD